MVEDHTPDTPTENSLADFIISASGPHKGIKQLF